MTEPTLPFPGLARSVEGADGGSAEPFLPGERIGLGVAPHARTLGAAYVNHLDDVTGSLEVGTRADLAVLDGDLFGHWASEITSAGVDHVFVDGQMVHVREGT